MGVCHKDKLPHKINLLRDYKFIPVTFTVTGFFLFKTRLEYKKAPIPKRNRGREKGRRRIQALVACCLGGLNQDLVPSPQGGGLDNLHG